MTATISQVRTSGSRVAAGLLLGFTVLEAGTAVVAGALSSLSLTGLGELLVPSNAVLGLALALAGWPMARHRPDGPIGWLLLGGGACWASTAAGIAVLACVADAGAADHVGWRVLATVVTASWSLALTVFLPLALLYFPDGRLPGRLTMPSTSPVLARLTTSG